MARVPIVILWDSRKEEIKVRPQLATVYTEPQDTALWTLMSDNESIRLEEPRFEHGPPTGPFQEIVERGPHQWEGIGLSGKKARIYKYTVKLSNGFSLDPALLEEDRP